MSENESGTTDRAEDFREAVAAMPVAGGTMARERQLARLGLLLLLAGPAIAVYAYFFSFGSDLAAEQRDAIVLAGVAVTVSILGLALYLRYSLGGVLRLWLARAVAERER